MNNKVKKETLDKIRNSSALNAYWLKLMLDKKIISEDDYKTLLIRNK